MPVIVSEICAVMCVHYRLENVETLKRRLMQILMSIISKRLMDLGELCRVHITSNILLHISDF